MHGLIPHSPRRKPISRSIWILAVFGYVVALILMLWSYLALTHQEPMWLLGRARADARAV